MTSRVKKIIVGVLGIGAIAGVGAVGQVDTTPEHLRVKAPREDILGEQVRNIRGREVVKYAYKGASIQTRNNEIVSKRTKHSRTFRNGGGSFTTEIISGEPQYYRDNSNEWFVADYATTTKQEYERQLDTVIPVAEAQTTDTFFPEPDPESGTTDGNIQSFSGDSGATGWDTVHAGTNLQADDSGNSLLVDTFTQGDGDVGIHKFLSYFDTSALPPGSTISSATYSLYVESKQDDINDAQSYMSVVQVQGNNISSDTSIATSDWDYVGDSLADPTEGVDSGDRADITNISTSTYLGFSLNATGQSWIAKSGETKPSGASSGITYLGIREGHDIEDDPPANFNGDNSRITVSTAENTGTSQDPKLSVTYTVPETFTPPPTNYNTD